MYLKDLIENWKNPLRFDTEKNIERSDILKILEAARWAPSAENQQVWRFLAIDDPIKKERIVKSIEEQDPRLTSTLHEIKNPVLRNSFIFSIENFNAKTDKYKGLISKNHTEDISCAESASLFIICTHKDTKLGNVFGFTDIGAAITNIILMTRELGFNIRWIRNFNRESLREDLDIPQSKIIDGILAIGKTVSEMEQFEHKNIDYEDYIYYNQWGNTLNTSNFKSNNSSYEDYDVEVVDAIVDRRSVRRYNRDKDVPKAITHELIKAGMMIPLCINKPYIKLIVVDDKEIQKQIADNAKFIMQKQPHVKKVPLIIAITYDCTNNSPGFYAEIDTGAIIQNMLLRAHSLGIGSCWIGAFSRKNVREILNIENNWHLPSLAIFGYPKKYPKPTPRISLGKLGYYYAWKLRVEKKHRVILPNYHVMSVAFRKIKKTRVHTILRKRKVGEIIGIPEFEKLK